MEYNTVFDIGERVWYVDENKIQNSVIEKIIFKKYLSPIDFKQNEVEIYYLENKKCITSFKLYRSKEELKRNL